MIMLLLGDASGDTVDSGTTFMQRRLFPFFKVNVMVIIFVNLRTGKTVSFWTF